MAKPVRLRTEIIVNVIILLGAALLCSGFLLLKLTERELVSQQVTAFSATAEILTSVLGVESKMAERIESYLALSSVPVEAWSLVDEQLLPVGQLSQRADFKLNMSDLRTVRQTLENEVRLVYDGPSWFSGDAENYLIVSLPLQRGAQFVGAVQLRFSLEELAERIRDAQRWFVGYVLVYGALLSAFGFYLLNRNVVRPIGRLRLATERIAAGDLELTPRVTGPREIAELSAAFASMVDALKESRAETAGHIASLEAANDDLRKAQRRLARSEKLATVGHLAAGMAHEIGNPLGAVSGYLELIRTETETIRSRELAERAVIETTRIDRLVRDLLDYARPSNDTPEDFVVADVFTDVVEMLRNQGVFEARCFNCMIPEKTLRVRIDRHRLQQVLVNLLLNARDATRKDQSITLALESEEGWGRMMVSDDGSGMPPEVVEHIFDPFYTTKDPDKGRGLGLAVCYRIVEDAGGRIDVFSAPGEGTTFAVLLPIMTNDEDPHV